jgi:NADH-quinone oxidoreductase subunit G
MIRKNGKLEIASWKEALELIVDKIEMFKSDGRLAGWGGDPLTVEENYLFQKLMREGCGVQHVDHRVGRPIFSLEDEGLAPGMESSFNDCENLSYAIFFGLDLTEEFPVLWLRLKPAIDRGTKVIFVGHYAPEIAPHLAKTVLHAPGQEISAIRNQIQEMRNYAQSDKPGAIFVGRQYLFQPQRKAILSELMKFKESFPHIKMNIMEGHCNSQGARFAGMRPDIGPMEQPLSKPGFDIVKVLQEGAQKGWDFLYVAGANPALKYPSAIWKKMREKLQFLVVQDLFLHETAQQADVVLPTLSFIEKNGSFITISGEVQQLLPGKDIPESIYSDGVIFTLLGEKLGLELALAENFMDKLRHLPKNKYETLSAKEFREERKTELAATFAPALFDHGVRMKHNPHAVWLAKEPKARLHPQEGVKKGIKDGDAIKITSNGASISATVKLDDKVAMGTTVLPMGFEELPVHELGLQLFNGIPIEIKEHHG